MPRARDDGVTILQNTEFAINVIYNDYDVDGTIDPATVTIVTDPANGTAVANDDGTVTYAPNPAFIGTDAFSYTVRDDFGATSNEATVTVDAKVEPRRPRLDRI